MSLKIGSTSFKWLLSAVKKLSQCVCVCVYWCVCVFVYILFAASPNIENICFNWFVVFCIRYCVFVLFLLVLVLCLLFLLVCCASGHFKHEALAMQGSSMSGGSH